PSPRPPKRSGSEPPAGLTAAPPRRPASPDRRTQAPLVKRPGVALRIRLRAPSSTARIGASHAQGHPEAEDGQQAEALDEGEAGEEGRQAGQEGQEVVPSRDVPARRPLPR